MVRQLPTLVVLAVLAGIGYVGYLTEWKVPKFSALWSQQEGPAEEPAIKLVPDATAERDPDPCIRQFQKLQIQFPEPDALVKAGLHFAPVATRPMALYVAANGTVDYDQTRIAHLSVPVAGIASRVEKRLGDRVKKGDVLALVESAEVGKAKADFKNYLVEVQTRKRRLDLLQPRTVSEVSMIDAQNALRTASIHLTNAQQTLINLGLPLRIEEVDKLSEHDLAERMRTLGLPESIVRTLDAQTASDNLIPLKAPFDGEVVGSDVVQGELVGPAKSVQFTVADLRRVWILLDVREEDRDRVHIGQEVTFRTDAGNGEPVTGRVSWLSSEMDQRTRTMRVRLEVENSGRRLLVHGFGTGQILVQAIPDAVAVPDEAIQTKDKCHMLFVRLADGKSLQTRLVKPGVHSGGYTQVLEGVGPGAEVVTVGSHALKAEVLRNLIAGE